MNEAMKRPRILVIEDNPDTRGIYQDVFEREGFKVLLAEDGEKGLSYAQASLPDVILLDLMLPKISGFEILRRLRSAEETRLIPVMIFSAREPTAEIKAAADFGATKFSAKAVNSPKQMVQRVRALITKAAAPELPAPAVKSWKVAVQESALDAAGLQTVLGLSNGFHCPQCQTDVHLELIPDATRPGGHWFVACFACSRCGKTL